MSEENNEQEVFIDFASVGDKIEIEFADGVHVIPAYVVNYLGTENLEKLAPLLKVKTYSEFLSGFNLKVQKDTVNNFQRNLISNHFSRRF